MIGVNFMKSGSSENSDGKKLSIPGMCAEVYIFSWARDFESWIDSDRRILSSSSIAMRAS